MSSADVHTDHAVLTPKFSCGRVRVHPRTDSVAGPGGAAIPQLLARQLQRHVRGRGARRRRRFAAPNRAMPGRRW